MKIRSFLWNAFPTRMCVHRCSLHQRAASAKRVNTRRPQAAEILLWRETNILYSLVSSALSQHASLSILSLERLCAMTDSIDIRYKPLIDMSPWVQTKSSSPLAHGPKQKSNWPPDAWCKPYVYWLIQWINRLTHKCLIITVVFEYTFQ